MLGYEDFKELSTRNLEERGFEPSYSRAAFREHVERDGEIEGMESAWARRDGSVIFVRESAHAVRGESGNVLYYDGIVEDITKRKRDEEELKASNDKLRALAARLQSAREEERARAARDIHDELGQALTAIKLDLSSLFHDLGADKKAKSKRILKLVDGAIQSVRRISTELRPAVLDVMGLVAAMEWAAEEFAARTRIKCRLDLPPDEMVINQESATALFRILQETLTNVARHSNATEVKVRLVKEDGNLTLEVQDNGKGVREEQLSAASSLGIIGMRERALLVGGELTMTGAPREGTTVRVRIPEAPSTPPEGDK
jgi:PAS domain S-box-containing protein